MFTQMIGSVPSSRQYSMNSLVPKRFDSSAYHASSVRRGRDSFGPTPSSQVVAAHEVAARPAEHREAEGTRRLQNIETKTARVGERGAFVVDAAVDAATEMLDELAEDARVHRADAPPEVDADARGHGARV